MTKKRKRLRGTVEKIIKTHNPSEPEKAQISIEEAEHLYREIRVDNELTDDAGTKSTLKAGADSDATMKKPVQTSQTADNLIAGKQ